MGLWTKVARAAQAFRKYGGGESRRGNRADVRFCLIDLPHGVLVAIDIIETLQCRCGQRKFSRRQVLTQVRHR